MKKAATASLVFAAITTCSPAIAETAMPQSEMYSWSGFYAGIEVGEGIGKSSRYFNQSGESTGDFNVSGYLGGLTAGYNQQFQSFVVGLEADMSGSSVNGSASCPGAGNTCGDSLLWLATVRPRIGYAFDKFLPFVTGGLAVGNIHSRAYNNSTGNVDDDQDTSMVPGWTAGAGLEAALTDHWSVKAEYLYVKLNGANVPSSIGVKTDIPFYENVTRVGLNYRFD